MGQLAKQLAERSIGSFVANTKKNSKEECMAVLTRSQMRENVGRKKKVEGVLEDVSNEEGENKKRENGENEKGKK